MCLGSIGVIDRTWDEGGLPMGFVEGDPVCLMYTPTAAAGDVVLTHLGYAVEVLDGEQASAAAALRLQAVEYELGKEQR